MAGGFREGSADVRGHVPALDRDRGSRRVCGGEQHQRGQRIDQVGVFNDQRCVDGVVAGVELRQETGLGLVLLGDQVVDAFVVDFGLIVGHDGTLLGLVGLL